MSEDIKEQLKQLTNDELIDFALEHLGQENEYVRHLALMEHCDRTKNDPNTVFAPPGDTELLKAKVAQLMDKAKK